MTTSPPLNSDTWSSLLKQGAANRDLLRSLREQREREEAAFQHLWPFAKMLWPILEPQTALKENWHLQVICEHLEAVSAYQIQNLIINVPPGSMKSLLVSVLWPAWQWLHRPSWRCIAASASIGLTLRDAMRNRDVITSNMYQEVFKPKWSLSEDQNAKGFFKTTETGFRKSVSVDGKVTGERGDAILVDDPLDAKEAFSKPARDTVLLWWDQAMANRVSDPARVQRVLIMQRLHEEDLTGHLLRQGGWEHLCIPMEYESARHCRTGIGWSDPRTEEGALMFEARFPRDVVEAERKRLGSAGYAGQMQQLPAAAEGNMFRRSDWRWWRPSGAAPALRRPKGSTELPSVEPPDRFDIIYISVDASFKDGAKTDFVAIQAWGLKDASRYLLRRLKKRMGFTDTLLSLEAFRKAYPRAKILIEDKANGSAIVDVLKGKVTGVIEINPEGGKESRAAAIQPQVEGGNVFLPEYDPTIEEYVDEFAAFPRGRNDDEVDATSQVLLYGATSREMMRARMLATL